MSASIELAYEYGVDVAFADLGDWGRDELRSEYDSNGPCIRINVRIAARLNDEELNEFIARAVGHELYHHREFLGEVERLPRRRDRELAAEAFSRRLFESS